MLSITEVNERIQDHISWLKQTIGPSLVKAITDEIERNNEEFSLQNKVALLAQTLQNNADIRKSTVAELRRNEETKKTYRVENDVKETICEDINQNETDEFVWKTVCTEELSKIQLKIMLQILEDTEKANCVKKTVLLRVKEIQYEVGNDRKVEFSSLDLETKFIDQLKEVDDEKTFNYLISSKLFPVTSNVDEDDNKSAHSALEETNDLASGIKKTKIEIDSLFLNFGNLGKVFKEFIGVLPNVFIPDGASPGCVQICENTNGSGFLLGVIVFETFCNTKERELVVKNVSRRGRAFNLAVRDYLSKLEDQDFKILSEIKQSEVETRECVKCLFDKIVENHDLFNFDIEFFTETVSTLENDQRESFKSMLDGVGNLVSEFLKGNEVFKKQLGLVLSLTKPRIFLSFEIISCFLKDIEKSAESSIWSTIRDTIVPENLPKGNIEGLDQVIKKLETSDLKVLLAENKVNANLLPLLLVLAVLRFQKILEEISSENKEDEVNEET